MCGKATLAMLVSSTSINVARVTVMAIAHGLRRGRQRAGATVPDAVPPSAIAGLRWLSLQFVAAVARSRATRATARSYLARARLRRAVVNADWASSKSVVVPMPART